MEKMYVVTFTFKNNDIGKRVKVAGPHPASAIRVATYQLTPDEERVVVEAEVKEG